MYNISQSDAKIMKDLVRELSEFNSYIKAGLVPFGREFIKGNYFYAFNPSTGTDKEMYEKNIKLLNTLYEILDENCININTASADELKTLSGIGDVTAEKIIEYRSSTAFKSKEDIMSVDGIGSKTYEKIKDDITV